MSEHIRPQFYFKEFRLNRDMDNILTYGAIVLITAMGTVYLTQKSGHPVEHNPAAQQHVNGESSFTVKAGPYETTYSLGRAVTEDMLAVSVRPQRRRKTPLDDFHSQMVSFTPKAANKYVKKYPGTKICPASFLNRNANHIDLYAANETVARKLSEWNRLEGGNVDGWERVKFDGNCVKKRTKIVKNGEDVTDSTRLIVMGNKGRGDCLAVYVRDLDIVPAEIFGPRKSRI